MRLLDLFCGAGGAAMGYHRAGFDEIVGIDIEAQKRYPFDFVLGDALEFLASEGAGFDVIHASPPCKGYTKLRHIHKTRHLKQIGNVRDMLTAIGKPYIIENVPDAKEDMINPLRLTGAMFGLKVKRPRLFETSPIIWFPPPIGHQPGRCAKRGEYDRGQNGLITVAGNNFNPKFAGKAMGINWMVAKELSQAIPPAYTEWIGLQILKRVAL